MVQQGLILRVLIASPGDVQAERKAIPEIIQNWNATHSFEKAAIVEPVKWESHAAPRQGDRPQAIINKQLGEVCDFLIGVFWTRLGQDTGVAASGTVEEIEEFLKANKPVMLYFSNAPVQPESIDQEQYSKLTNFKKEMKSKGLQHHYDDLTHLREQLARHLNGVVNEVLESNGWTLQPDVESCAN